MENNNRLQMDGIQNEKNTKWSKIKQIMLKELMNFAVVIVILAVVLVIVNIAFPNLKNRAYVWYYNMNHPYIENDAYLPNAFYRQGQNDYYALGTCGLTSIANAINIITDSTLYTENDVVKVAMDNDLCVKDTFPETMGATQTSDLVQIADILDPEGFIQVTVYNSQNMLSLDELADLISDPKTAAIVSVDSVAMTADDLATRTYKNNNSAADHRITVYDCIYDGSGNVTDFKIVDSGFGLDQVSKERFQIMYEGDEIHSIDEESIILLTYTK